MTLLAPLLRTLRTVAYGGRKTRDARRRPEWLPFWIATDTESRQHPHAASERGDLFLAHNAGSTEIDVLNWLRAPQVGGVLESRLSRGIVVLFPPSPEG